MVLNEYLVGNFFKKKEWKKEKMKVAWKEKNTTSCGQYCYATKLIYQIPSLLEIIDSSLIYSNCS